MIIGILYGAHGDTWTWTPSCKQLLKWLIHNQLCKAQLATGDISLQVCLVGGLDQGEIMFPPQRTTPQFVWDQTKTLERRWSWSAPGLNEQLSHQFKRTTLTRQMHQGLFVKAHLEDTPS